MLRVSRDRRREYALSYSSDGELSSLEAASVPRSSTLVNADFMLKKKKKHLLGASSLIPRLLIFKNRLAM